MLSNLPNIIKNEERNIKVSLPVDIDIYIESGNLKDIIDGFRNALNPYFQGVLLEVLRYFAKEYMQDGTLKKMFNSSEITWKTYKGNEITSIQTTFGKIWVPRLQVKYHDRGRRVYIRRLIFRDKAKG